MLDSIDELVRHIQLGEDSRRELKSMRVSGDRVTAPDSKDLADELAAMANTTGGVLVLGVDDVPRCGPTTVPAPTKDPPMPDDKPAATEPLGA